MNYANEFISKRQAEMQRNQSADNLTTGRGLGSTIGLDDPKAPHRAIPQAFSNLEKDLYALGELVNALNNRLKPISRPETTEVSKETASAMIDVPMVNAIAQADRMVRASLHQLQDILERIEL